MPRLSKEAQRAKLLKGCVTEQKKLDDAMERVNDLSVLPRTEYELIRKHLVCDDWCDLVDLPLVLKVDRCRKPWQTS